MANKFVAIFLMCMVVAAAMHISGTEAQATSDDKFKLCFNNCKTECQSNGGGSSLCEMKCDSECSAKEVIDKLTSYKFK